jgi:hypothetical protein
MMPAEHPHLLIRLRRLSAERQEPPRLSRAAKQAAVRSDRTPGIGWQSHGALAVMNRTGFEQIVVAIESGALLATMPHPNLARYPRQRIMIVRIDDYAFLVPFVEDEDHVFLKTIIPSRKATRDFIDKGSKDET